MFERNGCTGQEIYTHPHFIPYLRYFLFGADLPDAVIAKFEEKVGNPDWVTSGDIVPIGKCARDLARQYRLDQADTPEEFFRLCLDMGLRSNQDHHRPEDSCAPAKRWRRESRVALRAPMPVQDVVKPLARPKNDGSGFETV